MSGPNSAKQFLSSLNQQAHDINEIRSKAINVIDHIITDGDERLALEFLSQVGQALEQANYQPIEIKNFITGLPRFKQASKTFERALDNLVADKHPSFSQEKLPNLKRIPPVNVYLEQHQIKAHKTPLSLEQLFELPHNELPSLSVA